MHLHEGGLAASHHLLHSSRWFTAASLTRFTAASLRFTAPKMRGTDVSVIADLKLTNI